MVETTFIDEQWLVDRRAAPMMKERLISVFPDGVGFAKAYHYLLNRGEPYYAAWLLQYGTDLDLKIVRDSYDVRI
ncbi:hypothetical protein [Candidatus Magnetobacterium casense]|uniref:Uncharacterized protein n=1 Tax=Candidatus Magnetobacterium casense TaxID=1455061 RepID=A0ABS6S2P7_9BACT|nr:hypothetical protein [Candidatus Magnetobacterium casensis]MBV6343127.1 hypothetical protein [Candidatus Magnetobacterium casensis]